MTDRKSKMETQKDRRSKRRARCKSAECLLTQ